MSVRSTTTVSPAGIPDAVAVYSSTPGPTAVIFGGIHGNEPCGTHAIHRLLFDFTTGTRTLRCGTLLMAIGNVQALATRQRFGMCNLNRRLTDAPRTCTAKDCHECSRAEQLKPALATASYFLDLHSTSSSTEGFFLTNARDAAFFQGVGGGNVVTGWENIGGPLDGTTEAYARKYGAVAATFEAGQHDCAGAIRDAYGAAVRFIVAAGLMKAGPEDQREHRNHGRFILTGVWTKRTTTCRYLRKASSFMHLEGDERVVTDGVSGPQPPKGDYLIMPVADPSLVPVGNEVYFVGNRVD